MKDCESLCLWYDGSMLEIGLYSAIAPLVLLLLSSVWKYPAVLEEVVKWALLRTGTEKREYRTSDGAVVGLIFGLSEAVLFTMNAWTGGQWSVIGTRLILTVPMHILTATLIAWGMKKHWTIVMLLVAMVIHALFNYLAKLIL